ncbi:MAG: LysR substrate-binding domain-containing protein [Paracoccaceae bacterium]|nr:LysR substrate-binding domain-containing protein [Paracoccaceae bacterium]
MENLTLKQLRYFDALARHGHFGRAAVAASVSQPALSVQIREMERALGAELVERGPRQARLTPLGEQVRDRGREILRAVDELGELARASRDQPSGRLRLGVIPTIAPYLLPRLIGALTDAFPGLDIRVRETLTERLISELQEGRIDTAIVALPVSEPSLTETRLFDEALLLVRPAKDAAEPVPSRAALGEMRLLLLEEGHCFRDQALSFCESRPGAAREGLDGTSLATLVQMVGAGMGVTLLPEMAAGVETRSAAVSVARLGRPEPRRTVGMIWRRTTPLDAQLRAVANVVREVGATGALAEAG